MKIKTFIVLLLLCGCSSPDYEFGHNVIQPYYLDCIFNEFYDKEEVNIRTFIGFWDRQTSYTSVSDNYKGDMKLYIYVNESASSTYTNESLLIEAYDIEELYESKYEFSIVKIGSNYTVSYNSYEILKIPLSLFKNNFGSFSFAFSFISINDENSNFDNIGGASIYINYAIESNGKIVLS